MVKHTFIIITEDAGAAKEIAAIADKHLEVIDIDYEKVDRVRKIRNTDG